MDAASLESRFIALETKVAYQDKLIAELNEVLVQRTQELDALSRRLQALERFVREPPDDGTPPQERPPHY